MWRPGELEWLALATVKALPMEKLDLTQTKTAHNRHLKQLGILREPSMSLAIGGSRKDLREVCHLTNQVDELSAGANVHSAISKSLLCLCRQPQQSALSKLTMYLIEDERDNWNVLSHLLLP